MLLLGRNKVPDWIKQGGEPDWASGPCVCHLWPRGTIANYKLIVVFRSGTIITLEREKTKCWELFSLLGMIRVIYQLNVGAKENSER